MLGLPNATAAAYAADFDALTDRAKFTYVKLAVCVLSSEFAKRQEIIVRSTELDTHPCVSPLPSLNDSQGWPAAVIQHVTIDADAGQLLVRERVAAGVHVVAITTAKWTLDSSEGMARLQVPIKCVLSGAEAIIHKTASVDVICGTSLQSLKVPNTAVQLFLTAPTTPPMAAPLHLFIESVLPFDPNDKAFLSVFAERVHAQTTAYAERMRTPTSSDWRRSPGRTAAAIRKNPKSPLSTKKPRYE